MKLPVKTLQKDNTQTRCCLLCLFSNYCVVHCGSRNYTSKKLVNYRLNSWWLHDQSFEKCEHYKRHITLVSIHTSLELNSSDQTVNILFLLWVNKWLKQHTCQWYHISGNMLTYHLIPRESHFIGPASQTVNFLSNSNDFLLFTEMMTYLPDCHW